MADEYIEMNRSDNVKKIESEELKNPEDFLSLKGLLVRKVQEKEEVVQVSKETKGEKEEE